VKSNGILSVRVSIDGSAKKLGHLTDGQTDRQTAEQTWMVCRAADTGCTCI